jgi:hypothetical protein
MNEQTAEGDRDLFLAALTEQTAQRREMDHVLTVVAHQLLAIRAQVDAALAQVKRVIEGDEGAPRKAPMLPPVEEKPGKVYVFQRDQPHQTPFVPDGNPPRGE